MIGRLLFVRQRRPAVRIRGGVEINDMPVTPLIEFQSPERTEFLRMELVTDRPQDAVSFEFVLEATVHGFSARTKSWVDRIPLTEFTTALANLERTRTGRAELQGEDPEDLCVTLSAMDRVGHILLEFTLTRLSLVGDARQPVTLHFSGGFELDPGLLPALVSQFQEAAGGPT
jgi:hypothetical protein